MEKPPTISQDIWNKMSQESKVFFRFCNEMISFSDSVFATLLYVLETSYMEDIILWNEVNAKQNDFSIVKDNRLNSIGRSLYYLVTNFVLGDTYLKNKIIYSNISDLSLNDKQRNKLLNSKFKITHDNVLKVYKIKLYLNNPQTPNQSSLDDCVSNSR
jgi:hypothetical protein